MSLHPGHIASQTPDRDAVVIGDKRMSYGQLDDFGRKLAALLYSRGLNSGDVVALLIPNRPEFLAAAWAAQRSGLYYLPIPTRLTQDEISYMLEDSGAKALIIDPVFADKISENNVTSHLKVFGLDDGGAFESLTSAFGDFPYPSLIEGGDMLYTSGTTGKPKAVRRPLTGEPLGSDTRRVQRAEELFGLDSDSIFLIPAPLYHAAPLRFAMNLLRVGGTIVSMAKFDARDALGVIAQERVTHSQWVPTMFSRLLGLSAEEKNAVDLTSHQCAIHAGAPCPSSVKHQMIEWWGLILHEYYSGTESIGFAHISAPEWLERPGSVGRAYGSRIHIVGDTGAECPPLETGDIFFESNANLQYHNDAAKTASAHNANGWATMGDVGYLDEEGYLYITGRRHFTIISGGVNIYPTEIEAAIMEHPDVSDCAVYGSADPDFGEVVTAVVEHSGIAAGIDDALDLITHLKPHLAPQKLPKLILFASVERTETGKLQKTALKAKYQDHPDFIDLRHIQPKNRQTDAVQMTS